MNFFSKKNVERREMRAVAVKSENQNKVCIICDKPMECVHYILCSACLYGANKCGCQDNAIPSTVGLICDDSNIELKRAKKRIKIV